MAEMSGLSNKPIHGKGDPNATAPGDQFYDGWSNIKVGHSRVMVGCRSAGDRGSERACCGASMSGAKAFCYLRVPAIV